VSAPKHEPRFDDTTNLTAALITLVLCPVNLAAQAWTVSMLWNWHVVGLTGISIGPWTALGFVATIRVLTMRTSMARADNVDAGVRSLASSLVWLVGCGGWLALGWLALVAQ
jgi:predicted transporter